MPVSLRGNSRPARTFVAPSSRLDPPSSRGRRCARCVRERVNALHGARYVGRRRPHTDALIDFAQRGALVASVCTGTFLLGRAGLLDDRDCTTHSGARDQLAAEFPRARLHPATVVASGADLVTAANVSSGIDLSRYLTERFFGRELATRIADAINFAPRQREILEFA